MTRLDVLAAAALVLTVTALPAQADSCARSRDFLLQGFVDLPHRPEVYRGLYRECLETLRLSNVEDAFILEAGAIAVLPKRDHVAATARTLAQFCDRFPRRTLHFVARKDRKKAANVALAVRLKASRPTSCQRIKGES